MAELEPKYGDPNAYEKVVLASGYAHPDLADTTALAMGIDLGQVTHSSFLDTELWARYDDSVRGNNVFIMQSHVATEDGRSVNDAIFEQLIMIEAAKSSSSSFITAVCPYLGYARQDRKVVGRDPVSIRVVLNTLAVMGAQRIVAIDMHSPQSQAIFNGPFDHLTAQPLLRAAATESIASFDPEQCMIVSPDVGAAKMSEIHRDKMGVGLLHLTKTRSHEDTSKITRSNKKVDGVDGMVCLMFDDMIATASTLRTASETLKDSGAERIVVAATHGLFTGDAFKNLRDAPIDEVIITDTLPVGKACRNIGDKLRVVSVAPMIGRALFEIITDGSVSKIFEEQNYS
ncbi:ribose-phosphate diphosphokinase [soil metagenome]